MGTRHGFARIQSRISLGIAVAVALISLASTTAAAQTTTTVPQPVTPATPATIPPSDGSGQPATGGQVVNPPNGDNTPVRRSRFGVLALIYAFPPERLVLPPVRAAIDGPAVSINTDKAASVAFRGAAGQTIAVTANRPWKLEDPLGRTIANSGSVLLQDSGEYVLTVGPAVRPGVSVQIRSSNAASIVKKQAVPEDIVFDTSEIRPQVARMALRGGQRYRLVVPTGQKGARFCIEDWSHSRISDIGCVQSASPSSSVSDAQQDIDGSITFVPEADQEVAVLGSVSLNDADETAPLSIRARVAESVNDVVLDTTKNPIVSRAAEIDQSVVVPFWGTPAERAVLSSPVEADAKAWGDPWIDREVTDASNPALANNVKVFATPLAFDPGRAPFVKWSGARKASLESRVKRYGVYRGEDAVVSVPTTGEPVTITNSPWFAAVASMNFEPGDRYVVQVTGRNLRPLGLALRDPSGKFSSNRSPWQWTASDSEQRAITTVTADRGGLWALEMRPSGNSSKEFSVSSLRVGSGGSYLGSVEVDEVLNVGEKTDVQLGPNEFARLRVKLNSPTPQIIQPDVLRYRNKTFQPTAADMSIWDSRGRLVWSNNRNLEEEVLSGRLGKEPELSEKFATVSSAEPYTLVVSPKGDLAGRFRVSVTSTPVVSDVRLGAGLIPHLLGGTKTGVVDVPSVGRYRLTGASACIASSSLNEWSNQRHCVDDGRSISLSPGVYRFAFQPKPGTDDPLAANASFQVLDPSTPSDSVPVVPIAIDGAAVQVGAGVGDGVVSFSVPTAGTRVVLVDGAGDLVGGGLVRPDGDRQEFDGAFVAPLAGDYRLIVTLTSSPQTVSLRRAVAEVQTATIKLGAKPSIVSLLWGRRLEASVVIAKSGSYDIEIVADEKTHASLSFLFAANSREDRYTDTEFLPAGTYRFVFIGNGESRINIRRRLSR